MPCTAVADRTQSELSIEAVRLLEWLRYYADRPERARTDATIARALGVPPRSVIDLRDELLRAGYGVVASCTTPMGSYLTCDPQILADYRNRLMHRLRSIGGRAVAVRRVLEQIENDTYPRDSRGQGKLF